MARRKVELTLKRAAQFIFALGVDDLATELCRANTAIGLAKIHWVQQELGREPDALFLGGPDMTVTRNHARWEAGFAYGGKLDWRGGEEPLIVLQVKPNVCGMLVAGVKTLPPPEVLAERVASLRCEPGSLDGIPLEFDLDRSNHFVDVFRIPADSGLEARATLILHGAAPELRDDNPFGWGLYWDRSESLRGAARHFQTPWGPLDVLVGEAAQRYWQMHQQAADFAARRRLYFAFRLFDQVEVIANDLHQGLTSPGEMYLGCHPVTEASALLPFMIAPEVPSYLLQGYSNLRLETLEHLGWGQRAAEVGVTERLKQANLLPHGAGYAVAGPGEVLLREAAGRPQVVLRRGDQDLVNPREMATGYRGEEVLERTLELGLGEIACRLEFERLLVGPKLE